MQIIIKARGQLELKDEFRDYIEKKFRKFEKILTEPTILEIMVADVRGPQKGADKVVHLTASIPGRKNPEHIEELATGYHEAVDLVVERFKKFVERWKDKSKIGTRYPKKYYAAKLEEKDAREIAPLD